jgi:hypothetical protein
MRKLILGVIVGGAAVYFLDPEKGAERRGRLLGMVNKQEAPSTVLEESRGAGAIPREVKRVVGDEATAVKPRAVPTNGSLAGKPATT